MCSVRQFVATTVTLSMFVVATNAQDTDFPNPDWERVETFSDDFRSGIDSTKWSQSWPFENTRMATSDDGEEIEFLVDTWPNHFDQANVGIADNEYLTIRVEHRPITDREGVTWLFQTGSLNTKGLPSEHLNHQLTLPADIEVRAKGIDARILSAFWLSIDFSNPSLRDLPEERWFENEIDLFEVIRYGDPDREGAKDGGRVMPINLHNFVGNVHEVGAYPKSVSWDEFVKDFRNHQPDDPDPPFADPTQNFYDDWHRYGLRWREDKISFYLDGV